MNKSQGYLIDSGNLRGPFWDIIKFVLLFLYIYEFNFTAFGLPTFVTSRRIAVVIVSLFAILVVLFQGRKVHVFKALNYSASISFKRMLILHLFLFVYTFFIILLIGRGQGDNINDFIIKFLAFGLLPVWGFVQLFNNLDDFMTALMGCSIIQSIVILYCLVNPVFGEFIDMTFVQEGAIDHRYGYAGGIACITAPGLFRFTTGIIASLYFALTRKNSIIYFAVFLFLSFVGVMIARSGLIVALVGVGIIYRNYIKLGLVSRAFTVTISLFLIIVVGFWLFNQVDFLSLFDFNRLIDLKSGGTAGFFYGYFHGETTVIPPLSIETMIGTGITSGTSGNGITVIVDGGPLRLYVAYGLLLAFIFYVVFFKLVNKCVKSIDDVCIRQVFIYFVVVLIIAEYKEFTIYEQYMICVFYTMSILAGKNPISPVK